MQSLTIDSDNSQAFIISRMFAHQTAERGSHCAKQHWGSNIFHPKFSLVFSVRHKNKDFKVKENVGIWLLQATYTNVNLDQIFNVVWDSLGYHTFTCCSFTVHFNQQDRGAS